MEQQNDKHNYPILIVDDEQDIIDALKNYLIEFNIDYANDVDTALKKIEESNIRIVLSDIVMPGVDGIELLRRIKKINPGIQVIMMTGQSTLMRASESMQEGALTFLLKPFDDISVIDKAIDEAIRKIKEWKQILKSTSKSKKS